MHHIAIILAGGTGSRVGGETPKQFLPLKDGHSILEHSVEAFERAEFIEEICIVMHPDFITETQALVTKNNWPKVKAVIPGGKTRWESSYCAIQYYMKRMVFTLNNQLNEENPYPELPRFYDDNYVYLWFHDAARPFVSQRILSDINETISHGAMAVTVAVPTTDTMYFTHDENDGRNPYVLHVLDRSYVMQAQTPQVFRFDEIARAYVSYATNQYPQFVPTDDVNLYINSHGCSRIRIVEGEEANRKITYKADLDD